MSLRMISKCSSLFGSVGTKELKRLRESLIPRHEPVLLLASFSQDASTDSTVCRSHELKLNQEKQTVAHMMERWRCRFESEGISEPKDSIELIMAHVLGTTKIDALKSQHQRELVEEEIQKLEQLGECRLSRMPVQYIIGEWDFRDLKLKLEPPIFIPRPETENFVDHVLQRIDCSKSPQRGLEIGCGSGAISLSLLHSVKNVIMIAIDTNPHACELTLRNARELALGENLILLNATLNKDAALEIKSECHNPKSHKNFAENLDFIVSNPPYIPTENIFKLQLEISLYEDIRALDGGEDGLKLIKPILKFASRRLKPGGFLLLEVDSSHPEKIKDLVRDLYANELSFDFTHKDFRDVDRFVEISKTV
ncbi:hypothetical protein QAD02_022018 [Eretmocerus hayati]|uniref:Uncharacterized protein n=1 Tax=Eretmocerus hayati TaxID=131215 RepID=A0ACC2PUC3_9HYME|nr:hypothetical protein QAD02_022018 [Eretmocerus hayati]